MIVHPLFISHPKQKETTKMADSKPPKFQFVMFPWFAIGHMTPFLHLANKLADRGHKISFLLPNKAIPILHDHNRHPSLITFQPLIIPPVDGLPPDTVTASDIPIYLTTFLATAMDRTRPQVEQIITHLHPHFVLFDTAHWIPEITSKLGIKSISYNVICAASFAISVVPARSHYYRSDRAPPTAEELAVPPLGYPSTTVVMRKHEAHNLMFISMEFGSGVTFYDRISSTLKLADAIAFRTCKEIEGQFCDYIKTQFGRPVLLTGPVLPETGKATLEERWASWLGRFDEGSVVFCSFGSQFIFEKKQLQEILLGLEMTGSPFFVVLKPPTGCSTIEEALPEGFEGRVKGRGVVYGGWVEQPLILSHRAVGCFVNHCGFGTMWEALMKSRAQMVLVPQLGDQILNTRLMAGELKAAVEVEKEGGGWVSKERLCKAVKEAMDGESEVGRMIRENHAKWRDVLTSPGFTAGYIDSFVHKLEMLLN